MKRKKLLWLLTLLVIVVAAFLLYTPDIPLKEVEKKYTDVASRFVEIDGLKVHYKDEGKGMPVLLLHGLGASLHTWDGWTTQLKENHRVIRLDIPGFGITGPNAKNDYSDVWFSQFLDKFLKKIKVDSVSIAGNSMGGYIGWKYALKNNHVQKLILIDPVALPIENSSFFAVILCRIPVLNQTIKFITPRFISRKSIEILYGDPSKVTDALSDRYRDLLLREGNRSAFLAAANEDWYSQGEELRKLRLPVLVMWGKEDAAIPVEHAQKVVDMVPGASLKVYEGVGHMPMEEIAEKTAADAISFLR